jgi:hypothetical protein
MDRIYRIKIIMVHTENTKHTEKRIIIQLFTLSSPWLCVKWSLVAYEPGRRKKAEGRRNGLTGTGGISIMEGVEIGNEIWVWAGRDRS